MRTIFCKKLQKEAEGLAFAPYPGPLGERIFNEISKEAWQDWQKTQTMLINEYRLNLMDAEARKFLEGEMQKFLFEGQDVRPDEYQAPESEDQ